MYAKPIIEVTNFSSEDIVVNIHMSGSGEIIPNYELEDGDYD